MNWRCANCNSPCAPKAQLCSYCRNRLKKAIGEPSFSTRLAQTLPVIGGVVSFTLFPPFSVRDGIDVDNLIIIGVVCALCVVFSTLLSACARRKPVADESNF